MKIKLLYLIIMVMSVMNASGCSRNDSIVSVSAPAFGKEIKSDSVQLLDVRTPQEYAEGHIKGALNIDVESDDFYCRSGRRSLHAAEILTALGYKVIDLKGGIIGWKENDLPIIK